MIMKSTDILWSWGYDSLNSEQLVSWIKDWVGMSMVISIHLRIAINPSVYQTSSSAMFLSQGAFFRQLTVLEHIIHKQDIVVL